MSNGLRCPECGSWYSTDPSTDYVVHFTKNEYIAPTFHHAKERLKSILRAGFITPTFAPLGHRHDRTPRPTIQGPEAAVCLTEQPLSAFIKTPYKRYANYGIAYHKVALYNAGGRPGQVPWRLRILS